MNVPDHLRYLDSHEWIDAGSEPATVGISDHAQEELTDLVYVELPDLGREVSAGEPVAVVESVKSASDIYAPVAGTIEAVNEALSEDPALGNSDPYGQGWLFKIKVSDPAELDALLTAEAYREHIS